MKTIIINSKSFYILFILLVHCYSSNAQSNPTPPVYVLVHGAFHGGWCWHEVSKHLRSKGDIVYTPTLSGLGEHKNTLDSNINLDTHIEDIVNMIVMEDLHNVILVGHSYVGAVIAGVADRIPERLSKLVFLDALIVGNGQSANDLNPKDISDGFAKAAMQFDKGLSIPLLSSEFFGVTNPADVKWVNERLTNQPYRTFSQALSLKYIYGNHLSITYIACKNPELRAIKVSVEIAKKNKNWKYLELNTGHDAMITMPFELSQMLESLN